MKNEAGIDLSAIKRVKAHFSSGKPSLILKLFLPRAETESETFNSRFNAFYEEAVRAYLNECEKNHKLYDKAVRPATLTVECSQKQAPVGVISISRSFKLRLPSGEAVTGECLDSFCAESGLFIKEKRTKKANKSLHNKKKPVGN